MTNIVRITIALLFGLVVLGSVSAFASDTESPEGSSGDLFTLALKVSQTSSCANGEDCSTPSSCGENSGSQYCTGTDAGASGCCYNPYNTCIRGQTNAAIPDAHAISGKDFSDARTFTPKTHQKRTVGLCCW